MTATLPARSDRPRVVATGVADERWAPTVSGPARPGHVVHAGPDALYLVVGDTCIGILSARAVRVPCGVRTLLPVLPAVPVGAPALVGDAAIDLEGIHLTVATQAGTPLPQLPREALAGADDLLRTTTAASALVAAAAGVLPAASLQRLARADHRAVGELLGLGPGLTPLGDDVLCGWLALQCAVHPVTPGTDEMRLAVRELAPARTTTLSSTLLQCATDGATVPEFHSFVAGLAAHDPDRVRNGVDALARIGGTSGAGLVLGTALGLAAALTNPTNPITPDHARPSEEGPAR